MARTETPHRRAMAGFVRMAAVIGALASGGCVPIPVSQKSYAVDGRDLKVMPSGGGCTVNSTASNGYRQVGNVRVTVYFRTEHEGTPDARVRLTVGFSERTSTGRFTSVAVNPSRIELAESGRRMKARGVDRQESKFDGGKTRFLGTEMVFPSPSGVARTLAVSFAPGAIKIGGREVPFAPVRYNLKESPEIYLFPCIPA